MTNLVSMLRIVQSEHSDTLFVARLHGNKCEFTAQSMEAALTTGKEWAIEKHLTFYSVCIWSNQGGAI